MCYSIHLNGILKNGQELGKWVLWWHKGVAQMSGEERRSLHIWDGTVKGVPEHKTGLWLANKEEQNSSIMMGSYQLLEYPQRVFLHSFEMTGCEALQSSQNYG